MSLVLSFFRILASLLAGVLVVLGVQAGKLSAALESAVGLGAKGQLALGIMFAMITFAAFIFRGR